MKLYKKGDNVKTYHGKGIVKYVDCKTYSFPMNIIKLTTGKHKGQNIALTNSEINKQQ